jgi:hypothetical protein
MMHSPYFKIIALYIALLCFLVGCHHGYPQSEQSKIIRITPNIQVNAPPDSFVKPYINHNAFTEAKNYKVFLNANKGKKRIKTEYGTIEFPVNFKYLSFTLKGDENLMSLKTPLTLLSIINQNNKAILSLKLHNRIYWIETHIKGQSKSDRIPLFLDYAKGEFIVTHNKDSIHLKIGDYTKNIAHDTQDYKLKIGITRHDLLRYSGIYLPEQTLYINNMITQ